MRRQHLHGKIENEAQEVPEIAHGLTRARNRGEVVDYEVELSLLLRVRLQVRHAVVDDDLGNENESCNKEYKE